MTRDPITENVIHCDVCVLNPATSRAVICAFNISSDKATGIGAWRDDDLISYLSIGRADSRGRSIRRSLSRRNALQCLIDQKFLPTAAK